MNDKLINFTKLENFDLKIIRNKKFFKTHSFTFYDKNNVLIGEYNIIDNYLKIGNKSIKINIELKEFTILSVYFIYNNKMFDFEASYNNNILTSINFIKNNDSKNFNFIKLNNYENSSKSNKNLQILMNNTELFKLYKYSNNHFRVIFDLYDLNLSQESLIVYIILILIFLTLQKTIL